MNENSFTASTIISFAEYLEEKSIRFYEELAYKFSNNKDVFLSFVKESKANKIKIRRTYQETVTDAFETGFSFENLNLDEFKADFQIPNKISDALKTALELEKESIQFYSTVAIKSKALLGTISTDLYIIAEKRKKHREILEQLLEEP